MIVDFVFYILLVYVRLTQTYTLELSKSLGFLMFLLLVYVRFV
jgi:hypothetical protein